MNFEQKIYYTNHNNLKKIDPKSLKLEMVPKKMRFSQSLGVSQNEPYKLIISLKENICTNNKCLHNTKRLVFATVVMKQSGCRIGHLIKNVVS